MQTITLLFNRHMKRLVNCQRGIAAVEMALIAPVLITLLLGVVDSTMGYNRKMVLNYAAQAGVEEYTAAGSRWSSLSAASIQAMVADLAGVENNKVTVSRWLECNHVKMASGVITCGSGEISSQYVKVAVTDTYLPIFRIIAQSVPVSGSAYVRFQ